MAKIIPYVALLCGCIIVIILTDFIEGRGILKGKQSSKAVQNVDDSVGIHLKGRDERLPSENIKGPRCDSPECKSGPTEKHRRRHRHGRKNKSHKKKHSKKTSKKKKKNRRRQNKKITTTPAIKPEDIMQRGETPADRYDLAYDQYYAGQGRSFGRVQRPPEADRLERRLHPNVATSAHNLLTSIDRVVLALKDNLHEMHDKYDFAFNSTRYTIMMGVREELTSIAKSNDMVYDVMMDISLLTKDIYMRAHKNGLTRPRTVTMDMPKFKSLSDDMTSAYKEQRSAMTNRNEAKRMVDDCNRQTSYLQQIQEKLTDNKNTRELLDLRRHVNMTLFKLQAEFDTFMVVEKLSRHSFMNGVTTHDDNQEARRLVREAKHALRMAVHNQRGNLIAYEDYRRRQSGDDYSLAPVSFTDLRSRPHSRSRSRSRSRPDHRRRSRSRRATTGDISPAEKARLRPIIDRAVRHASELRDKANRIVRRLRPILRQADDIIDGGNGKVSYRAQASLLAEKLRKDVQNIRLMLDRIRIAINDEDELRQRCEELEIGSGDDGEATPIDCDDILDGGSGNWTDEVTPTDPDEESDFVFEGDKVPVPSTGKNVKRLGDKLEIHIVELKQKSELTLVRAQTSGNKTQELSKRWAGAKTNLGIADNFVTSAKMFLSDWKREQPDIDRISDRIKKVHEEVDFIANLTKSKTFQAVLKAERKVAEVKGGGGRGSGSTTNGENSGSESQDFASAIEATGKAKRNMQSILTLTQVAPSLVAGVEKRVSQIKSNISSLRNKVDKARLVLSSLQMSINKQDEGYLPLPLTSSDESQSLHTSVEMCIRPEGTDGPVLLVAGNNAESYSLSMDSKTLKMKVYDSGGYDVGEVDSDIDIEKETWYNVLLQRNGSKVALSVRPEGDGEASTVESDMKMAYSQPPPQTAYIGGAPDNLPMSVGSGVWKGCVGGLRVNGRSVGLFQKSSESNVPVPCASHCSPSPGPPSLVFEGDGYVQYPVTVEQLRRNIRSVYFEFRTRQENAFLISVVKRGFQLRCQLNDGTLLIETTTRSEAVVLRSSNSKYNDGVFHTLNIVYRDSTTYPEIDGKEFAIESTRPERIQSPAEGILIGGMPQEHSERMGGRFSPLIGCMRKLQINKDSLSMSEVEKAEGVHVGSCSKHNMWLSCVEFVNASSPIAYGTTEDAETIVIVATRGSTGPVLHYQKGDKFNAIISLTKSGIEIHESEKDFEARIPFSSDNNSFVSIKITDDSSDVKVEYLDQVASFSYEGAFSGWFGNGQKSPYTITIGGQEEDSTMPLFTGGIAQMIVGEVYLDMSKYIDDNKLSSCSRPPVSNPGTETVTVEARRR